MIRTHSFSEPGGHPVNEDAFVLRPVEGGWLAAVADGMGGRAGGRRAAQLACETVANSPNPFHARLSEADNAVAADREAGFTTLVALHLSETRVEGASCGDSAAVAVCGGAAPKVLTSRQFKNPPVGSGEAAFVPFALDLASPWRVLLMSDGVWKYASWDRVWDVAARLSGEELIHALADAARLPATGEFQDDFTLVVLEGE
jgi:serine/threonine protein phosphatase PrpC